MDSLEQKDMGRIYGMEIGVSVPYLQLNSLQLTFLTCPLS